MEGTVNMPDLSQILDDAVGRQDVPFIVAMVANGDGVLWEGHSGNRTASTPAGLDTTFRLFSMTKAIGSLAALIMIERGKFSLETEVAEILPEFARLQVLESMGPAGAVFSPPRRAVTVRHLLTHTSGLMYGEYEPRKLRDWQESVNAPHLLTGTKDALFSYPMVAHPGESWQYGVGLDWVGLVVQAVDGRSIDRFVIDEILEPLGMSSTVFEADQCSDTLADLSLRGADGTFRPMDLPLPAKPEFYGMGQNLYSTAGDYIRFLRMVLNRGELDGNRVISRQGIEPMFTNHIGDLSVQALRSLAPDIAVDAENFPGHRKTHTIGFVRMEESIPGMRGEGSLQWAGVSNTHFWVDPDKDLAAVFMSQSLPFFDPRFMKAFGAFERAAFSQFVG
jgi:methyl acetate hydrolase